MPTPTTTATANSSNGNALVGKMFIAPVGGDGRFSPSQNDRRVVGKVASSLGNGTYLVRILSWRDHTPLHLRVVSAAEMTAWQFANGPDGIRTMQASVIDTRFPAPLVAASVSRSSNPPATPRSSLLRTPARRR